MPPLPPADAGPVLTWMLHPPELADLYDYWVNQDVDHDVPRWRPLQKETMSLWLGSLFIIRFADPESEELKLGGVGRRILNRLGFDPSDPANDPKNPSRRLFVDKCYVMSRTERRPVYTESNFFRSEGAVPIPYTRLTLPYVNADGILDRLLCGLYFLAPGTRVDSKTVTLDRKLPEVPVA